MYSKTSVTVTKHGQLSKLYIKMIVGNAYMSRFHLFFLSPATDVSEFKRVPPLVQIKGKNL